MTTSTDPVVVGSPVAPANLEHLFGRHPVRVALERLGPARLLALLDLAAVLVVVATFAQLAPPELLFHVAFVILTIEAFLFGRRICLERVAAVSIVLLVYATLPAFGSRVAPLELTEWPLMLTIAVLVAWMADREQSAARRFAGLYREARDRLVRAQEEERARIARDLHDGIGQTLTALALTLDAVPSITPAHAVVELEHSRSLAREAIDQIRLTAQQIRPPRLAERGLAAALRSTASPSSGSVTVTIGPAAEKRLVEPDVELEVFRIAEEALRNALRHSSARRIDVALSTHRGLLVLAVDDDGCGFDRTAVDPRRLGLVGMAERASAVGGTLALTTAPGGGTRVRLTVPVQVSVAGGGGGR